ncbi:class I SAM-dependent methyltransferase [Kordiimonas sp. SCSIO 12603]|uniref:class I SAM-dependent methyltransferase n=1 Tax=Kordiimonas sp. SCSIO 12603 TaxID=2829596 RepID=UPI002105CE92|nr:class I SAM-dependent methyltransferase [Kordiimonas sp. SCSIO 12603]UTW58950.1 class I SAM-dependent methyltransferase [Kordiimonas sp. SCSIO 12603]
MTDLTCIQCGKSYKSMIDTSDTIPIMIDFSDSVFTEDLYSSSKKTEYNLPSRSFHFKGMLRALYYKVIRPFSGSKINFSYIKNFINQNNQESINVLIIGGGTKGHGIDQILSLEKANIVSVDVYPSNYVDIICDGSNLPFPDKYFDVVITQSVIEHVLTPHKLVNEIHRVLNNNGIVYAETSFVQQIHEGAYDFSRYSLSGHRWLFKHFDEIKSGCISGPGFALNWAIKYFMLGVTRSEAIAKLSSLLFFWLNWFDLIIPHKYKKLGAAEVYFLGEKSNTNIDQYDIINYFDKSYNEQN